MHELQGRLQLGSQAASRRRRNALLWRTPRPRNESSRGPPSLPCHCSLRRGWCALSRYRSRSPQFRGASIRSQIFSAGVAGHMGRTVRRVWPCRPLQSRAVRIEHGSADAIAPVHAARFYGQVVHHGLRLTAGRATTARTSPPRARPMRGATNQWRGPRNSLVGPIGL